MSPHRDPLAGRAGRLSARALAVICAMSSGIAAATTLALAAGAPHGRLVQSAGEAGCLHPKALARCGRARAITEPVDIAVSPDGRHAYVAAFRSNAVAVFRRNRRTGALRQLPGKRGCTSHRGRGSCQFGRALAAPTSVTVSPDGRNVYVVATGSDAISVFARNLRSGALRQLPGARGCVSQLPGGGCRDGRALNEPIEVAISRDGERVYVAARAFPSAIAVLDRDAAGALHQADGLGGCVSSGGSGGCAPGRGLRRPWDLEVSPDSQHVYVASLTATPSRS
jgi:DNA-binding beta-propeller fold protein YncE